jgi:hypothetical protein
MAVNVEAHTPDDLVGAFLDPAQRMIGPDPVLNLRHRESSGK